MTSLINTAASFGSIGATLLSGYIMALTGGSLSTTRARFANLLSGFFVAISDIVLFAYQLDITREGQRGAGIALYNTFIGVATFFGSLFGGYLPALLASVGITEVVSIQLAYAVSAIGRLGGGLLFRQIQEPTYPSTVRHELTRIVSEDIERAQDQLEQLELRGESIGDEFQEDFDGIVGVTRKKEDE